MVDNIAASILTKLFGDYIEGINSDNLSVSLLSGNVTLKNLNFKKDVLEPLEMPLYFVDGHLKSLTMKVPWRNLNKEPTVIRLSGISLLVGPKSSEQYDEKAVQERLKETKMRSLEVAESLGWTDPDEHTVEYTYDPPEKKTGYFEGIAMNVIDNMQIFIEDIHIRYEDKENDFAFGICLDEAHLFSAGPDWKKEESVGSNIMRKVLSLANFSVYFNMQPVFKEYSTPKGFEEVMSTSNLDEEKSYLFEPCAGKLKLDVNMTTGDLRRPKAIIQAALESLSINLSKTQYEQIIGLLNFFSDYNTNVQYQKFKPGDDSSPQQEPQVWWEYVINTLRSIVADKEKTWSWEYVEKRRKQAEKYIDLYRKMKVHNNLSKTELSRKTAIELAYPIDDIITWRKLTNAELRHEKTEKDKQSSGIFNKLFGKKPAPIEHLSQKELYSKIGFEKTDEHEVESLPEDYKQLEFHFLLEGVTLCFKDQVNNDIVTGSLQNLSIDVDIYSKCVNIFIALEKVELLGYYNSTTIPLLNINQDELENLINLELSINPLDKEVSTYVKLNILPVIVTYNKEVIDRFVDFFNIQEDIPVEDIAGTSLEAVRSQAQIFAKYALDEKEQLLLEISAHAPTVIVPLNGGGELVLNLGSLNMMSDLSHNDTSELDIFYDTYNIALTNINAYILVNDEKQMLLDDIEIGVCFQTRTALTPELPLMKASIELEKISLALNADKIKKLLSVAEVFQGNPEVTTQLISEPSQTVSVISDTTDITPLLPIDYSVKNLPLFEGKFLLKEVSVALIFDDNNSLEFILGSTHLDLVQTSTSLAANLEMGYLTLLDSEVEIISSPKTESFSLQLSFAHDDAIEYDNLSVNFTGLEIMARQQPLIALGGNLLKLSSIFEAKPGDIVEITETEQEKIIEVVPAEEPQKMNIDVSVGILKVSLAKELPFLSLGAEKFGLKMKMDGDMAIEIGLGNLFCIDHQKEKWSDILSMSNKEDETLTVHFKSFQNPTGPYNSELEITINSINAVVMSSTISEVLDFVLPLQEIAPSTPAEATAVPTKSDVMKMSVTVLNPIITVPESEDSENALSLDLGRIGFSSFYDDETSTELQNVNISNIEIFANKTCLLKNGNVSVEITPTSQTINVESLDFAITPKSVRHIIDITTQNLLTLASYPFPKSTEQPIVETNNTQSHLLLNITSVNVQLIMDDMDLVLRLMNTHISVDQDGENSAIIIEILDFVLDDGKHPMIYKKNDEHFTKIKMLTTPQNQDITVDITDIYVTALYAVVAHSMSILLPLQDDINNFVSALPESETPETPVVKDIAELNLKLRLGSLNIVLCSGSEGDFLDSLNLRLDTFSLLYFDDGKGENRITFEHAAIELGSADYDSTTGTQSQYVQIIQPILATMDIHVVETTRKLFMNISPIDIIISYQDVSLALNIVNQWMKITEFLPANTEPVVTENELPITNIDNTISIELEPFSFSIIDDIQNFLNPVLQLSFDATKIQLKESGTENQIFFRLLNLRLDSFNQERNTWESALEPSTVICKGKKIGEEQGLTFNIDNFDFNLSLHMMNNLFELIDFVAPLVDNESYSKKKMNSRYESKYVLINQSGVPLLYRWDDDDDLLIENMEEKPLSSSLVRSKVIKKQNQELHLTLAHNNAVLPPLDIKGGSVIVSMFDPEKPTHRIIYDIFNDRGSIIVLIRSSYAIQNKLDTSIKVKVINSITSDEIIKEIPSQSKYGIPIEFTENKFHLEFRPSSSHDWTPYDFGEYLTTVHKKKSNTWTCGINVEEHRYNGYLDKTIVLDSLFQIENNMASEIKINVNTSMRTSDYVIPVGKSKDLSLSITSIMIKIPGFQISEPINFPITESPLKVKLYEENNNTKYATILLDALKNKSRTYVAIYSKYWIINKSGLPLNFGVPDAKAKKLKSSKSSKLESSDQSSWYDAPLDLSYYGEHGPTNIFYHNEEKLNVSIPGGAHSENIPVASIGGFFTVQEANLNYNLTLTSTLGTKNFWRTSIIRISPAFILVNNLDVPFAFRQKGQKEWNVLDENSQRPLHFSGENDLGNLEISVNESFVPPAIDITKLGNFKLQLTYDDHNEIFAVSIFIENGLTFFKISRDLEAIIGYRVRNDSDIDFKVRQESGQEEIIVGSNQMVDILWQFPQQSKVLVLDYMTKSGKYKTLKTINLDSIKKRKSVTVEKTPISREVKVLDNCKVLIIAEKSNEIAEEIEEMFSLKVALNIERISVSLISNFEKQFEMLYMALTGIEVGYDVSDHQTYLSFNIINLQIDNQLYLTPYPVLLYVPNAEIPFLVSTLIINNKSTSVSHFKYFGICLQEMNICIDQIFLTYILDFVSKFAAKIEPLVSSNKMQMILSGEVPDIHHIYVQENAATSKAIYFENFIINSGKASLSFSTAVRRSYDIDASTLDWIFKIIGFCANMERTPFVLEGLYLKHSFSTQEDFVSRITGFYTTSALSQIYKVIGNFDFLGSPVSLIDSLGTGFVSFVTEPSKGAVSSPGDFALGVGKGTGLLVKNTIYGVFNSASKVTGAVAKLGETLTFDDDYRRKREISKQKEARHVGEGLAFGARDLGKGIAGGITGIFTEPVKGAKKGGAFGFVKGVGKGLAGAVMKPTVGVVDVVTRTTEGIKNTTTYFDRRDIKRMRFPRFFKNNKIIPYDDYRSQGQYLLYTIENGRFREEQYLGHVIPSEKDKKTLILSDQSLICSIKDLSNSTVVGWRVRSDIFEVTEIHETSVKLTIYNEKYQSSVKDIVFSDPKTLQLANETVFTVPDKSDINLENFEGFLHKEAKGKLWKKRWFVLKSGELIYKRSTTSSPKGSIRIRGSTISATKVEKKYFTFIIAQKDNKIQHLYAESQEELDTWFHHLIIHGASHEIGLTEQKK